MSDQQTTVPALGQQTVQGVAAGASRRMLVTLAFVDAVGSGSFLAVSAIFLIRHVDLSINQVGFGLAVGAAVSLCSSVPLGFVADRYGPKRILTIAYLWRGVGFTAYAFVTNFGSFLTVVILLALLDKVLGPLAQALVGMAVPEDQRVRTMATMSAVRNVGFSAGALLGGLALAFDTRGAYMVMILLNAASFFAMTAIVTRIPLAPDAPGGGAKVRRSLSWAVFTDRPYLVLAGLNSILALHMTLLSVGIPVWVASRSHVPTAFLSVLLTTNTVIAVLFQVRVSRGASSLAGAARLSRISGIGIAACCCLLILVPVVPRYAAMAVLFASVVMLTIGEMYQTAGGWGISYKLAPKGSESSYLTLFWMGAGVQQIVAPILIAVVVGAGSLWWFGVAVVVAAAGFAVAPAAHWSTRLAAQRADQLSA